MQKAIIGKKVGMTQIFDESGSDSRSPLSRPARASFPRRRPLRTMAMFPCSWASRM